MELQSLIKLNHIILFACLVCSSSAWAAKVYPIITYSCDPGSDTLKIKNEVKWDNEGAKFKYSPQDGIYNPWDWVQIVNIQGYHHVKQSGSVERSCQLASGLYKVLIEPKIFNGNYDGKCGDRLSVKVSITRDGAELLTDQEFETFCHGNAPVVRGIKVTNGKLKVVKIPKASFY